MAYISYLDLVGTKQLAKSNPEKAKEALILFSQMLENLANKYSDIVVAAFSDSAYCNSTDLDIFIQFFSELRISLFQSELYFTASLVQGDVGELFKCKNKYYGLVLTSPDIVNAYSVQNSLKGIGISVDRTLISQNKSSFINSYYFANEQCITAVPFCDIKYVGSKDVLLSLLKNLIWMFIKVGFMSLRAQRYYISPIYSVLESFDNQYILTDEILKKLLNILENVCSDNSGKHVLNVEHLCAIVLNRIFRAYKEQNFEYEDLIGAIYTKPYFSKLVLSLNKVSDSLLVPNFKQSIVDIYTEKSFEISS
jgi:hypothetical protein